MKSRSGTQSRPSGCWQSQQTAKVMRKPAGQESKSAGKGSCLNASDRRVQVQLTQEAKIVPGFPSYSGNFCICRLCLRSDGVTNPGPVQVVKHLQENARGREALSHFYRTRRTYGAGQFLRPESPLSRAKIVFLQFLLTSRSGTCEN